MNTYDFVHLTLFALGGEVRGKTKLQKTVYFVGILSGSLEELGYRPHFYGPYSAEVAGAVDRLRALGFVDQQVVGRGAVDQEGFEVARYDFTLNDQGKQIAQAKAYKYSGEWEKIRKAVEFLKKADQPDYVKLSIAAKTYFMLGEKKETASEEELASLANTFGWSVTPQQVMEAGRFLESLGLVEIGHPE
jgi:uncharacterized protein